LPDAGDHLENLEDKIVANGSPSRVDGRALGSRLRASKVAWKRLVYLGALTALVAVGVNYAIHSFVLAGADGLVLRQRIAVAVPYDARIRRVFVRPGDPIAVGDRIALVESVSINRSLAELSAERARLGSRIAGLEARKLMVASLLPYAEANAKQTQLFLDQLNGFGRDGVATNRYVQEMTTANFTAAERLASLRAENVSTSEEILQNRTALDEMSSAYQSLKDIYNDGVLVAAASGNVGSSVAPEGEVLVPGNSVLQVFSGEAFVLAYISDNFLVDLTEGQRVMVKGGGRSIASRIEKIFPMTDALPPEFQKPVRARDRAQVVRIALPVGESFAVEQKVHVTACLLDSCEGVFKAALSSAPKIAQRLKDWLDEQRLAITGAAKGTYPV
jgi:multidrug resistance efflux pump